MAKGQARILLHGKREFLIKELKECSTLYEIAITLELEGVKVSISSLYRFMVSDLGDYYFEYLRYTGRGLVRNRQANDRLRIAKKAGSSTHSAMRPETINNPGDVNKFLKDNTKRYI